MHKFLRYIAAFLAGMLLAHSSPVAAKFSDDEMILRAAPYLPILREEQLDHWRDHPQPSTLAAQVEQESLWNPKAELKTSREYGFGFGQLTKTSRFDTFVEVKRLDPSLREWAWEDRFDPRMQLRALVLKTKAGYTTLKDEGETYVDVLAFAYAAYNGGMGGVLSDRRVCSATTGCNPRRWFDHVERTSLKAKSAASGYGKSFFEINREYVRNILIVRREKYDQFF